tara:strand:- start:84 stop:809 length:726 start_codon:yes stop_codon:yes gene_type:complete
MDNTNIDDQWYMVMPPNIHLLKCELGSTAIKYLWDCIEKAKVKKENANKHLAGNISESLYLDDEDGYFWKNHLEYSCEKYLEEYPQANCFRNSFSNVRTTKMVMREFWVNFSKQTEFNPLHNHGGVLSFVIWMKIPTKSEDQHNLPISKNTTAPASSDFMFTYTDILGSINPMQMDMDPEIEGTMIIFPSILPHQVYPFYGTDKERISISGNMYYDQEMWKQGQHEGKWKWGTNRNNYVEE